MRKREAWALSGMDNVHAETVVAESSLVSGEFFLDGCAGAAGVSLSGAIAWLWKVTDHSCCGAQLFSAWGKVFNTRI